MMRLAEAYQPMTMFIDVTHTLATGATTGIQRVVRELAGRLLLDVDVVLVAARAGCFHPLNACGLMELGQPINGAGASTPGDRRMGSALLAVPALFERVQSWNFDRRIRSRIVACTEPTACRFGPADVLILLDAFWGGASVPSAAAAARRAGAKIVTVVYDMIPVTHPHFMEAATVAVFGRRLRRVLPHADAVVTISRACTASVRTFLGNHAPPIHHFYLGGDFAALAVAGRRHGAPRTFVMVGTVEPRKGHALVLDCFDRLWAQGEDVELTFVGRIGWADSELVSRCRNHAERGRRFHHYEDADDATLAAIVGRSDATIAASAVEGFGLPVIESLVRGIPVIASDIAVFREIGADAALYFRQGDDRDLERAIDCFRSDPEPWRARAAKFRWISWDAATEQFRAEVALALRTVVLTAALPPSRAGGNGR